MRKRKKESIAIIAALLVFTVLLFLSQVYYLRIDPDSENLSPLSEISRRSLENLPNNLRLEYYVSENLERRSYIPKQVESQLNELRRAFPSKIDIQLHRLPSGQAEPELEQLGITPTNLEIVEEGERSYVQVYSAIVLNYGGNRALLPEVYHPRMLEYQLNVKLRELTGEGKKSVGILLGHGSQRTRRSYSLLEQTLASRYDLVFLSPGDELPKFLDGLLIFGGERLEVEDLFLIDQYLMSGNRVFWGIEAVWIDTQQNLQAKEIGQRPAFDLLEHYGVGVRKALVLDESARNYRVPSQDFGSVRWEVLDTYPHWVRILRENSNEAHPVADGYQGLDLLWPSPLQIDPHRIDGTKELVSLFESSSEAWLMEERYFTNPYDAADLHVLGAESAGRYKLGLALRGRFESYFADQREELPNGLIEPTEDLRKSSEEAELIVVGDSDFATDTIQYSDSLYNLDFLLSVAEYLVGDEDLMRLRRRSVRAYPQLTGSSRDKINLVMARSRFLSLILVPSIILLYGFFRYRRRR